MNKGKIVGTVRSKEPTKTTRTASMQMLTGSQPSCSKAATQPQGNMNMLDVMLRMKREKEAQDAAGGVSWRNSGFSSGDTTQSRPANFRLLLDHLKTNFAEKESDMDVGPHKTPIPFTIGSNGKLRIDSTSGFLHFLLSNPEDKHLLSNCVEALLYLAHIQDDVDRMVLKYVPSYYKDLRSALLAVGQTKVPSRFLMGDKRVGDLIFQYFEEVNGPIREKIFNNPDLIYAMTEEELRLHFFNEMPSDYQELAGTFCSLLQLSPPKGDSRGVAVGAESPSVLKSTTVLDDSSNAPSKTTPEEEIPLEGSSLDVLNAIKAHFASHLEVKDFINGGELARMFRWFALSKPSAHTNIKNVRAFLTILAENAIVSDDEVVDAILSAKRNVNTKWKLSADKLKLWYILKVGGQEGRGLNRSGGHTSIIKGLVIDKCSMLGLISD